MVLPIAHGCRVMCLAMEKHPPRPQKSDSPFPAEVSGSLPKAGASGAPPPPVLEFLTG